MHFFHTYKKCNFNFKNFGTFLKILRLKLYNAVFATRLLWREQELFLFFRG